MKRNMMVQFSVRTDLRAGATTYPDMSGVCNPAVPPTNPGTGTYPDMSGVCSTSGGGTTPPPTAFPDMSGVC